MTWLVFAIAARVARAPLAVARALGVVFDIRTRRGRLLLLALAATVALAWIQRNRRRAAARRKRAKQRWQRALRGQSIVADMKRAGMKPGEFVDIGSGKVHYLLEGPEDGELIVMFHGFGVFSYVYHQLMGPLTERGYRVLAFDFYGFGWSTANDGATYNADLFVQQAYDLVVALDLATPFTLVAHSMGGLMGTIFSVRYPHLVRRLMLLAPAGLPVDGYSANMYMSLIHSAKSLVELPFVGDAMTRVLMKLIAAQVKAVVRVGMNKRTLSYNTLCQTPRGLSRVTSELDLRESGGRFVGMLDMTAKGMAFQSEHNPEFWRTICETLSNLDLFGDWVSTFRALGEFHERIPVLVCWGDQDEFLPFRNCDKLLRPALPHARYVYFMDTDHFLFLNRREEFLAELLGFINDTGTPAGAATAPDTQATAGSEMHGIEAQVDANPITSAPPRSIGAGRAAVTHYDATERRNSVPQASDAAPTGAAAGAATGVSKSAAESDVVRPSYAAVAAGRADPGATGSGAPA